MTELKPEAVAAVVSGKAMPADIFTGESLAKYFARKYLDMLAQRDMHKNAEISWEKAMMEAIGEDGAGSVAKAIAELKAHRGALAAECATLKDINAWCQTEAFQNMYREFKTAEAIGCPDVDCMHDAMLTALMHAPKTPATESYLNSVRAEGVEMVVQALIENGVCTSSHTVGYFTHFAAKIRAGEPS